MQVAPEQQSLCVTHGYSPPPLLHLQTSLAQYWLQQDEPPVEQASPTALQLPPVPLELPEVVLPELPRVVPPLAELEAFSQTPAVHTPAPQQSPSDAQGEPLPLQAQTPMTQDWLQQAALAPHTALTFAQVAPEVVPERPVEEPVVALAPVPEVVRETVLPVEPSVALTVPGDSVQTSATQVPLQQSASMSHALPRPASRLSGMQLEQSADRSQPVGQVRVHESLPRFPFAAAVGVHAPPSVEANRAAQAARDVRSGFIARPPLHSRSPPSHSWSGWSRTCTAGR